LFHEELGPNMELPQNVYHQKTAFLYVAKLHNVISLKLGHYIMFMYDKNIKTLYLCCVVYSFWWIEWIRPPIPFETHCGLANLSQSLALWYKYMEHKRQTECNTPFVTPKYMAEKEFQWQLSRVFCLHNYIFFQLILF
jgi:hypothetical protein